MRHLLSVTLLCTLVTFASVSACTSTADDCRNTSSCPEPSAGASGSAASGGMSGSSGSALGGKSGEASGGRAGSGAQSAGEGGSAGAAGGQGGAALPCDGACGGAAPICDEAAEQCVECLGPGDCTAPAALCDVTPGKCVECLQESDCTTAAASRCEAGLCAPCSSNADCAHIAGKGVCDAGECVQCTGTDYAACGMEAGTPLVCSGATKTCTTNKQKSAGLCAACVSDAHCRAGQLCLMERYGTPPMELGYRCLWRKGDTQGAAPAQCSSARPYVETLVDQVSIDGVEADACGLAVSTCTAVNEYRSKNCATSMVPDDSQCGVDAPSDAKCVMFDANVYRCTITCLSVDDCPNGSACDTGSTPWVCEL
jgi:hypothetical protein